MKALFKIFTILSKEQYLSCAGIILAMIIGAILEAVGIGAILPMISILGQSDFLPSHPQVAAFVAEFGITDHASFVIVAAFVLIGIFLLKNIYIAWETHLQIRFSVKNQIYYSKALMAEYLAKPYLFHVNVNTGTLIRNVNMGAQVAFGMILIPMFQLLTELVTATAIWIMLVLVDPFTAIVVAGVLGTLLTGILKLFRRKVTTQGIIQSQYSAQCIKWLNQGLGAIKETKVMHKEKFFVDEFNTVYQMLGMSQGKFNFLNMLPRTIIEAVVISGLLLLIVFKVAMGNRPEDIVPLLGVLALAAFRLMPSANRIVALVNGIKYQMPFFNEIYPELMLIRHRQEQDMPVAVEGNAEKMPFANVLEVKNVGFRYPDGKQDVLDSVSFTIPKGKFVGIVGPSGAGKTTFVDILLGLLPPTTGSIFIDGKDFQEDVRGWQENLAYVPQSIYLIDGTIKENIALGMDAAKVDDGKIEKALRMAELYEYVATLPDGIETKVGERGVKLSGGQRQRIGIARALFQEPEVLILDEATSALDNETEKNITETILKLKGKITIIAIAHRVSTLEECDFKVRFQDGRAEITG